MNTIYKIILFSMGLFSFQFVSSLSKAETNKTKAKTKFSLATPSAFSPPAPQYDSFMFLEENPNALGSNLSVQVEHFLRILKFGTYDQRMADQIYNSITPEFKSSVLNEIPDGIYLIESYQEQVHPIDPTLPRGIIAHIIHIDRTKLRYNGLSHQTDAEWVYIPDPSKKEMYQIPMELGSSESRGTHSVSVANENLIHQIGLWRMRADPRTLFDMSYYKAKSKNDQDDSAFLFQAAKRHFYRMSAMERFETMEIEWQNKTYQVGKIIDPFVGKVSFKLSDPNSFNASLRSKNEGRYVIINGENRGSSHSRIFESQGLNNELYQEMKIGNFKYIPYKPVLDLQNIHVLGNEKDVRITVLLLPQDHLQRLDQIRNEENRHSWSDSYVYPKYGFIVEFNPMDPQNSMTVRDVGYDKNERVYIAEFSGFGVKKFVYNESREVERESRVGIHLLGQFISTSGFKFVGEKRALIETPLRPIDMSSPFGDVSKVVDMVLEEITPNKNPNNFKLPTEYLSQPSNSRGKMALSLGQGEVQKAKDDRDGLGSSKNENKKANMRKTTPLLENKNACKKLF